MAWIAPKTDWAASDGVTNADMNRIEGNILDVYNSELKGQITVTSASWIASGNTRFPFKKDVPIAGVVATDKPISFDFTLATYEIAEAAEMKYVECYNGGITLYGTAATPAGSVTADYVVRKA